MSEHAQQLTANGIALPAAGVPKLTGSWLRLARITWLILAMAMVLVLALSLPGYALKWGGQLDHAPTESPTISVRIFAMLSVLASLTSSFLSLGLAWMLFRRRFEESAAAVLSFYLLVYAVVMAGPLEAAGAYWTGDFGLAQAIQGVLLALPTVALFLLFPNGRFVPPWTRWILILSIPWSISLVYLVGNDLASFTSPSDLELGLLFIWYSIFVVIGLYAQVYRFRRVSSPAERQQTKWVVFGFGLWLTYILVSSVPYYYVLRLPPDAPTPWWLPASELGWFLGLSIVPLSLVMAITRYRLWDIDLVINRALVYGALTAGVIGIYALVVGGMGILFQAQGSPFVALAATGLVAVLFHPLRERLQGWVNRLVYGQRDEPFEVLARLGQRLEATLSPEMVYPTILETVAQTLKLPYTALAVREGDSFEIAASYGKPHGHLVTYPLTYQGEIVGQLQIAGRMPNEEFNEADDRLLRSIAQQAGAAVHAVQVTADLQRSRQRLVTTREEERRRLRRDLHDGLGPRLAAHILAIGSARAKLADDPLAADQLLARLEDETERTLNEIRRLVYDLRPPVLDQLGLAGAVHECAAQYENQALAVSVNIPDPLPPLPAAVEVAVYRIVQEGLANVAHHAQAEHCQIRLAHDKALHLAVVDDGRGLPTDLRAGVGLTSMRERAAELGGSCTIGPAQGGGVQISVTLPTAG